MGRLTGLCAALALGLIAGQARDLPSRLAECRSIRSDVERLAAYDALADEVAAQQAPASIHLDLDVSRDHTAGIVKSSCVVTRDPYLGSTTVRSPLWAARDAKFSLVRVRGKDGDADFISIVPDGGPLSVRWAADVRARELVTSSDIEKNVEVALVHLPPHYIEEQAPVGIDIKASGRNGEVVLKVPPSYVFGFLSRCADEIP